MAYVWQRWLADELRPALEAEGFRLIEVEGWRNRGRPASTGDFNPNGAHTKHHTGTTTSPERNIPTLRVLIEGRPDLPGPLSHIATAYNGDVYLIAAGRANHAGAIGKSGVAGMPVGFDGNARAIGDEVDTNGTQPLNQKQRRSMAITAHVITKHYGKGPEYVHRHEDISSTGKWDIGNISTRQIREDTQQVSNGRDWFSMASKDELREVITEAVRATPIYDRQAKKELPLRTILSTTQGQARAATQASIKAIEGINEVKAALAALAASLPDEVAADVVSKIGDRIDVEVIVRAATEADAEDA